MTAVPHASPIPSPWRLEPLTPARVPELIALARVVWQDTYPALIPQAQIDHMLAERYRPEALNSHCGAPQPGWGECWMTACLDGAMVGFACLETTDQPGEFKLDKLYVHPQVQGRGVGRALVEWAASCARGGGGQTLVLAVNKGNARALAAYRAYGFRQRAAVCREIGHGFVMDDFIMARPLQAAACAE